MDARDLKLLDRLTRVAEGAFDGHLTIMKFTGNWRITFGTPMPRDPMELRDMIDAMPVGSTFAEAATALLERVRVVSPPRRGEKENADPD